MKRVITMVLYNRPNYTRAVLDALARCDGIGNYLLLVRVEPANDEVIALARAIDFVETRVHINESRLGIGLNTFLAWEAGFQEAGFIIHIEDDTVPAPDCLRYMEHCFREYQNDPEIFSVASYHRCPCEPERHYEISRRWSYTCWLVGLWVDRWLLAKDLWSPSPECYATHLANEVQKRGLKEVYPLLSRSQNIGAEGGVHVPSVQWHHQYQHTEHWAGQCELKSGVYHERRPSLVTAVMVTGLHSKHHIPPRIAIECFRKQTYPNTELLIVNHGEELLLCGDRRIREFRVAKPPKESFEDSTNLIIESAQGEFLISWDQDDWHHPRRIELQAAAAQGEAVVLLRRRLRCSLVNGCAHCETVPNGIPGTILHRRTVPLRHVSQVGRVSPEFDRRFTRRIVIDNDPLLCIRVCHGMESWNACRNGPHADDTVMAEHLAIGEARQTELEEVVNLYAGLL